MSTNEAAHGFAPEDFAELAQGIRDFAQNSPVFHSLLSNNFNTILAALDLASMVSKEPAARHVKMDDQKIAAEISSVVHAAGSGGLGRGELTASLIEVFHRALASLPPAQGEPVAVGVVVENASSDHGPGIRWNGAPPTIGTSLYTSPPSPAVTALREALEAPPFEARSRIRLHHGAETTARALFVRARRLDQVAGFGYEMGDFLTDLVPFLAALSHTTGEPEK